MGLIFGGRYKQKMTRAQRYNAKAKEAQEKERVRGIVERNRTRQKLHDSSEENIKKHRVENSSTQSQTMARYWCPVCKQYWTGPYTQDYDSKTMHGPAPTLEHPKHRRHGHGYNLDAT